MSINKILIVATFIGLLIGASSCKKYLDVNTNPNGVKVPTVQTLLPAAELYVGSAQGVDLEIAGSFFAQYWTQSPGASQYHSLDQYQPGQDAFNGAWTDLYTAAENFYQLYKLADTQKNKQYMAISLLMQAYTFQLIADGWGDAPCKQALKGQYADGHLVNPVYDAQDSIYKVILAYIDSANVLIDPNATIKPGADDLIYGGNMSKWQEFSNTLALRVYMRLSEKLPAVAQAGITALYANSVTATFIGSTAGDDAFIAYGYNSANNNPLYSEEAGLSYYQNFVASNTCMDSLKSNNDPRLYLFYEPNTTGAYVGLPQGKYNNIPYTGYSFPTVYVAGDAGNVHATTAYKSGNAPVNLLTSYESLFLQAEAVARGWAPGATSTDDALFYAGIQASFNYYALQLNDVYGAPATTTIYNDYITGALGTGPGYWTVYPTTGTVQQKVEFIIVQKWFAMCGNQGFEAWTEWRRTGYPNWFTYSVSNATGNNSFPKRLTYPSSESTVNTSFPGLQPLTAKVWWDAPSATDH